MFPVVLLTLGLTGSPPEFAHCGATLDDDSRGRSAATCVRLAADANGHWDDAIAWLETAWRQHPGSGWLALQIADAKTRRHAPDALQWHTTAVASLAAAADHRGEAEGRIALGVALDQAGRHDDAWSEAPKIRLAAERTKDAPLVARAYIYEGWLAHRTGQRLSHALRSLEHAATLVFPEGPYAQQVRVLFGLGNVSFDLGRYDVALTHFTRATDLARREGDQAMAALAASNVLTTRRKQMEVRPDRSRLPEFTSEARRLTAVADELGRPELQAISHRALGDLLASAAATHDRARREYELALHHARRSQSQTETATCLWALGRYLSDRHPGESRTLVDEALRMAVQSGSATAMAYAWRQQMRLAWKTLPRDRALAESLRALDAIETLRTLQDADLERASVLGAWTADYYWLIGRLLEPVPRSRESLAMAFAVSERMRARVLLETLQRQRSRNDRTADSRRDEVLRAISAVQRRLLDPAVLGHERESALADLERLERDEAGLRGEAGAGQAALTPHALATLDAIERSLDADEAMLSFTVGVGLNFYGEFGGGAWLLIVTRAGTRAVELPDRTHLEPVLSVFRGLVERADMTDDAPAVTLYHLLAGAAVETLPRSVIRLIVVADGALHHLPFAVLKPNALAPALGSTHEIVATPSATLWRQLKHNPAPAGTGSALVLADPTMRDAERTPLAASLRNWSWLALESGSLAHARAEGRAIVRRAGGDSRMLAGADATEAAVKASPAAFTIIHFATHAFVDDTRPERSAVLLSRTGTDDGLLQAREIADLALHGRVVVLSACRTATGAVLAGEGVVGLSRAFFEAGARTVVGTLWAIRDDHAARFGESMYASLAEGRSVAAALREAQRRAIAAGLPAAAWGAFVVIGDGSAVPLRPSAPSWTGTRLLILAGVVAVLQFVLLLWCGAARQNPSAGEHNVTSDTRSATPGRGRKSRSSP